MSCILFLLNKNYNKKDTKKITHTHTHAQPRKIDRQTQPQTQFLHVYFSMAHHNNKNTPFYNSV